MSQLITALVGYIWARESNEHDKEIYSIKEQVEGCLEQARRDGVFVPPENIFRVQFSGVDLFKIPELKTLWQRIEANERPKVIYCWVQDRMIRGKTRTDIFYISTRCREANTKLFLVKKQIELTAATIGQDIEILVDGHKASTEIEDIIDRTWNRGRLKRMKEGKISNAGPQKYGYRRIRETGKAEIIEEQAVYIRKAADLLEQGFGYVTVARKFNEQGIPSPSGRRWSATAINHFFTDPAYKGEGYGWRYNKKKGGPLIRRAKKDWIKLADDAYPPIIEPERWDRINAQINKNKGVKARQIKQFWLLRGLVVCDCGAAAYPVRCGNKNSENPKDLIYRHYQCSRKDKERLAGQPRTCFVERANAPELEAIVWAKACEYVRNPELILERVRAGQPQTERDYGAEIAALERATAGKLTEIRRLAERLRTAPRVVADHIENEMVSAEAERQALESQITELRQKAGDHARFEQGLTGLAELAAQIAGSLDELTDEEKRQVLEALPFVFTLRGEALIKSALR